jgi:hypothetical protein
MKGTWQTTDGGGSGLAVPLAIGAAVLAAAVAGPVAAAVGELLRAVVIIAAVAAALALAAVAVAVALRLRGGHNRPRLLPPRVHGSASVHAVQDRPEPRALPARQEVHLHFHGVDAEDVAAILRDVPDP